MASKSVAIIKKTSGLRAVFLFRLLDHVNEPEVFSVALYRDPETPRHFPFSDLPGQRKGPNSRRAVCRRVDGVDEVAAKEKPRALDWVAGLFAFGVSRDLRRHRGVLRVLLLEQHLLFPGYQRNQRVFFGVHVLGSPKSPSISFFPLQNALL